MDFFAKTVKKISGFDRVRVEGRGTQLIVFGLFGIINYPTFYFVWQSTTQKYESLTLRLIATFLCFLLVVKNYWPKKLQPYLPMFWYLSLIYCLPFFGTFMLLKNHGSTMWITNAMLVLMVLTLLVDWLSFAVILILGVTIAFVAYCITDGTYFTLDDYTGTLSTYLSAIVIAAIFSHTREKLEQAKSQAVLAVGASVAHELRTPLLSIDGGISGIKRYLPKFMDTYILAKKAGLAIPKIHPHQYESLLTILDDVSAETHYANTVIDMLLIKAQHNNISTTELSINSLNDCIDEALHRYPFSSSGQLHLIEWNMENNFSFKGNKLLFTHVLFNLLKNALYFIAEAKKGKILIWTSLGEKFNSLHFKDTSKGISPAIKLHLFERFFSNTRNGTGLGLAFSKMVMISFGGNIVCKSKEGEFTEFILTFPVIQTIAST
jgi:signal transduction histidine kinase